MTRNRSPETLLQLANRQRKNPAYQLRVDGYRWNITQIAKALNFDRATVRRRLQAAGIAPDGRVHGTDVFEISRAVPVLFGAAPRPPKV